MKLTAVARVLKGVPRIMSPELLSVLARMGHGDQIVLADGNFPSEGICKHGPELVSADGHGAVPILQAVAQFFPLDQFVEKPVSIMAKVPKDKDLETPIIAEFENVLNISEGHKVQFDEVERFAFYEQAKKSFAVVRTGETSLYACIILTKGVIPV